MVAPSELGHQPLHVAAPAARLRARGHEVRAVDLSVDTWDPEAVAWADRVAFSVPMHTATRLVRELAAGIDKPVCCYGLYAAMCADVAERVIAGEWDEAIVEWAEGHALGASVELGRGAAAPGLRPARDLLPALDRYAHLAVDGEP